MKFSDATNEVVVDENRSFLASTLDAETLALVEPSDDPAPLTPAEQLAKLDAENVLTQRNLREFIMLTSEAVKAATGGAVDMTVLPGVAKVYSVEAEATELRVQL